MATTRPAACLALSLLPFTAQSAELLGRAVLLAATFSPGQPDNNEFILIGPDQPLAVPEPGSLLLPAAMAGYFDMRRRTPRH